MAPDLDFGKGIKRKTLTLLFRHAPHTLVFGRYVYAKVYENTIYLMRKIFYKMKIILKGAIGH